ncbi:MAG: hypothetical protein KDC44_00045 [Phaeodactylibacter sp.]|nr:hypothetical protein [Phaeodactylibacter sp.]
MKTSVLFSLFALLLLESCYLGTPNRSYAVNYDEFSGARQTYLNKVYPTREIMRCHSCRDCYLVDFRLNYNGNASPDSSTFVQIFIKDPDEYVPNLSKKALLKIDDNPYEIELFHIRGLLDNNPQVDSTGIVLSNQVAKTHVADFYIKEGMLDQIQYAERVTFRFYSGAIYPYTVELVNFNLGEVKRFAVLALQNQ